MSFDPSLVTPVAPAAGPIVSTAGGTNVNLDSLGGSWTLDGGYVRGGSFSSSGANSLIATTSGGTLDGVTLNANLDVTASQADLASVNGLTLNATATLGQYARIYFNNTQTLGGSGDVLFQGTLPNALIANATAMTLTVGPQMTIHGGSTYATYGGTIGSSQYWGNPAGTTVINQGTLDADGGASTHLIVNPNGGAFVNQGTLQASKGSTLSVSGLGGSVGNAIVGDAGSVLALNGSYCAEPESLSSGRNHTGSVWQLDQSRGTEHQRHQRHPRPGQRL